MTCTLYCYQGLGFVCFVASHILFCNHRLCLERYDMSRSFAREVIFFLFSVTVKLRDECVKLLLSLCRALWRILRAKMKNLAG